MSLLPEEKYKTEPGINLTPMIDFLFLMLALFATMAVSRSTLYDTNLKLVQLKTDPQKMPVSFSSCPHQINISINKEGSYTWISDIQNYPMQNLKKIQDELSYQHSIGVLPKEKKETSVLLHIDQNAPWDSVAKLIFAVREEGFEAFPIFEPEETAKNK